MYLFDRKVHIFLEGHKSLQNINCRFDRYSLINMRQLQILLKPKLDIGLLVDFCVFTYFYQFLQDVIIKLF